MFRKAGVLLCCLLAVAAYAQEVAVFPQLGLEIFYILNL